MAPAVAALAGAGLVALWRWARTSWAGVGRARPRRARAPPGSRSRCCTARRTSRPSLRTAIPVAAALAVFGSVALRLPGTLPRGTVAVAAVAAALAVAGGPAAYSVATAGRALDGNNVTAGPASSAGAGGPGGGFALATGGGAPGGSGATGAATAAHAGRRERSSTGAAAAANAPGALMAGGGDGGIGSATLAYLMAHQGSAKYLVAATGSQTTAGIIITDRQAGGHDRRLQRRRPDADRVAARGDGAQGRAALRAALRPAASAAPTAAIRRSAPGCSSTAPP